MKKRFTFLIAALMLLVFMMPTMVGWGQSTVTFDASKDVTNKTHTSYTNVLTTFNCDDGSTWKAIGFQETQYTWIGPGKGGANYLETPEVNGTISSVAVTWSGNTSHYLALQTTSGTELDAKSNPSSSSTETFNVSGTYSQLRLVGRRASGTDNALAKIEKVVVTYTTSGGGSSVATPQLSKGTSYCDEEQSITITCDTEDATIYYTLDGSEPTSSSTPYSGAISITETKTLRAIAVKDEESSAEASATYTFVTTLKTMEAIYAAATAAGSTATTVYIHFNNFVISAINSGSPSTVAYLTDGTNGCYIFSSGHGFAAGNVLNGIASCSLKKNYTMSYITGLTASSPDLVITDGGTVSPVVTTIDALSGINTGSVVTIKDLTWNSSETTFSDGTYTIKLSNAISNQSSLLTNGNKYDITGVFDYNSSSEKRINPRNAADVVPGPATLPFEWAGGGKNALMALQGVTANGLGADYADANAPYLVKFDTNGDYILVKTDSQPGVVTIGVKKFGSGNTTIKVQGSVDGETFSDVDTLTFDISQNNTQTLSTKNSFNANVRYVRIIRNSGANVGVGPITITKYIEKYNISLSSPTTGGSFTADKATAAAGETVTLTPEAASHYTFTSWTVCKTGDPSTIVTVNNNQFEMPAYAVTVSATFTELPVRTITIPNNIASNVAVDVTEAYAGDEVTITVVAPEDEFLTSLTVTGNTTSNPITLSPEVSSSEDTYTFIMPDENVTISATFAGEYTVQFSVNGTSTGSPTVTSGDVTLPSQIDVPDGFDFPGWTTDPTNFNNIITGSSYTPTADVTLYAVFSRTITGPTVTTYNKVSSISEGYYLIVCENSNVAFDGSLGTLDAVGNTISVNIENNTIASSASTDGAVFTISAVQGGYSIQSASEYYIGQTTDANGLQSSAETVYTNSISFNDGNADIVSSGGAYLRYNSASNQTRFRYYKSSTYASQGAIQLYKKETTAPSTTEYYTRIQSITGTTEITTVTPADLITVPSGAVLTITGPCTGGPENLIIEDGGQLIIPDNTKVKATVQKATAGSSAEKTEANNLYAISSPVDDIKISSFAQGTHNVYQYYEPTSTWQEYRNASNEFDNLAIGRGYLYRSSVENIELAGDVTGGDKDGEVKYTLSYAYGVAKYKGLNLVGNPFTHDITWSDLTLENVESSGCYMLVEDPADNDHGKWKAVLAASVTVKPMQAFFVQATSADASITFNNSAAKGINYANDNIMFSVKNSKCSDEAYVMFAEGHGLNKIEHRNSEIPMLYIMNNGQNYAIADMSDDTEVINIGFEAKTMGQYTFSIKTEGQYSYMHLVDKLTGEDVDMLVEDSYTFVGAPNDRKDRFVLNLNYNAANINTDSDIFAYQSGSDIIIRGDGELHVFDVMGRLVLTQRVNGVETISMQSQGVYIFKLNGMTQKIVVK